jgi:hypothetical protein
MMNIMPLLSNTSAILRYSNSQMYDHPTKPVLFSEIVSLLRSASMEQCNMYVTIIVSLLIFYLIIRDLYVLLQEVEKIFEWRIFIMNIIIFIVEIQTLVSLNYFLTGGTIDRNRVQSKSLKVNLILK